MTRRVRLAACAVISRFSLSRRCGRSMSRLVCVLALRITSRLTSTKTTGSANRHDGTSWHLLDVECAARPAETWEHDFAPTDVPRSRFLFASDAWMATKNNSLDAARCGVSVIAVTGQRFIAASLMRDQAAMLKVELKPWDVWGRALLPRGISDKEVLASEELEAVAKRLDAASNTAGAGPPDGYENWDRPTAVVSYPFGEPLEVKVM